MRDVKEIILSEEDYDFILDRLYWSLENKIEDCGVFTVERIGDTARICNNYIFPDEYKKKGSIRTLDLEESEWYKSFLNDLSQKREKIGFYYHTHSRVEESSSEVHEEGYTSRRTRKRKTEKSDATKKIGDIIIEMLENKKVHIHGYTPASKPFLKQHPTLDIKDLRDVHSLNISIPHLGKTYDSFVS